MPRLPEDRTPALGFRGKFERHPECVDTYSSVDTKHAHKSRYMRRHTHALPAPGQLPHPADTCAHTSPTGWSRVSLCWPNGSVRMLPSGSDFRASLQTPVAAPGSRDRAPLPRGPKAAARVWYARPVCPQGQASKCSLCSLARREPCPAPAAYPRGSRKASVLQCRPGRPLGQSVRFLPVTWAPI